MRWCIGTLALGLEREAERRAIQPAEALPSIHLYIHLSIHPSTYLLSFQQTARLARLMMHDPVLLEHSSHISSHPR